MMIASDHRDKYYKTAWWLVAVTIPWATAFNNLSLFLLIIIWAIDGRFYEKWLSLAKSKWVYPFVLLFLLYAIGLIYAEDLTSGVKALVRKIPILVLPPIAATGPTLETSFVDKIKRGFAYSCLTMTLASLCIAAVRFYTEGLSTENLGIAESQYRSLHSTVSLAWLHFSYIQVGRWGSLHPSYFSMYLLFSIIILLNEETLSRKQTIIKSAAVIVMIVFIALLASRMAIFAFLVTAFFWIVKDINRRMPKEIVRFGVVILILIVLAWLNPVTRFRMIEEPMNTSMAVNKNTMEWNSVSYRLLEWKGAWSAILQNPIIGVGTGDGDQALKSFYATYNASTVSVDYNAHNQYLQTWMEIGVLGFMLCLLCFTTPFWNARLSSVDVSLAIIFSMMCLTESMLERQKGIIFFSVFFSLFLCRKKAD